MDTACAESTVPPSLVATPAVCADISMVISLGSAVVWAMTPESMAVVSAAGTSTTEGVPLYTIVSTNVK